MIVVFHRIYYKLSTKEKKKKTPNNINTAPSRSIHATVYTSQSEVGVDVIPPGGVRPDIFDTSKRSSIPQDSFSLASRGFFVCFSNISRQKDATPSVGLHRDRTTVGGHDREDHARVRHRRLSSSRNAEPQPRRQGASLNYFSFHDFPPRQSVTTNKMLKESIHPFIPQTVAFEEKEPPS